MDNNDTLINRQNSCRIEYAIWAFVRAVWTHGLILHILKLYNYLEQNLIDATSYVHGQYLKSAHCIVIILIKSIIIISSLILFCMSDLLLLLLLVSLQTG